MNPPDLAGLLGISFPLILAPMAGGGSTPALAAAVSNAGGLGSLGAAFLTGEQITAEVAALRQLTNRPFAINLVVGGREDAIHPNPDTSGAVAILARHHADLGLPPPATPSWPENRLAAQVEAMLAARPTLFSFTYGIAAPEVLKACRAAGILTAGSATTVEEALLLADAGVDIVVAQGAEAAGHRATFAGDPIASLVGLFALVPQIADAVPHLPVIAAGAIMDARGIRAALALGAAGAQMGTAFLVTDESGAAPAYKARVLAAREDETVLTRAFSGRTARGIANRFIADMHAAGPAATLPYPMQNSATVPMRNAAAAAGDAERLSLWAGQGLRMARPGPAGALAAALGAAVWGR